MNKTDMFNNEVVYLIMRLCIFGVKLTTLDETLDVCQITVKSTGNVYLRSLAYSL